MTLFRMAVALAAALILSKAAASNDVPESVWPHLTRIESAFHHSDAGALRQCFSSRGKIHVDLNDLNDGQASYGASQLEMIFSQIFDEHATREFSFRKSDVKVPGPGTAFARARWLHRDAAGRESSRNLTFTLRDEAGEWRIVEIRSSR